MILAGIAMLVWSYRRGRSEAAHALP